MDYFPDRSTVAIVKARFRDLVLIHHPDRGGNPDVMKEINRQYPIARETAKLNEARGVPPAGARPGPARGPSRDGPHARQDGPRWASSEPSGESYRGRAYDDFRGRWAGSSRYAANESEEARKKGETLYAKHKPTIDYLSRRFPLLVFEFVGDWLIVAGKTYEAREHLKAFGLMWCPLWRRWYKPGIDPLILSESYDVMVRRFGRIAVRISHDVSAEETPRNERYVWDSSDET